MSCSNYVKRHRELMAGSLLGSIGSVLGLHTPGLLLQCSVLGAMLVAFALLLGLPRHTNAV